MSSAADVVVRREVVVDVPIDKAFALFVERFGDFKPKEHNLLGAEIVETRLALEHRNLDRHGPGWEAVARRRRRGRRLAALPGPLRRARRSTRLSGIDRRRRRRRTPH